MNLLGIIGGIITIIGGILKFIEFRDDRKGKIIVKLYYYDDYGIFGSSKRPYFIVTITNVGKKNRKIFKPNINHKLTRIFYEPTDETIKYPYNLEPGDQLVVNVDFRYIGQNLEMHNDVLKNTGGRRICKFEVISEVVDTLGVKYKSNKFIIKV